MRLRTSLAFPLALLMLAACSLMPQGESAPRPLGAAEIRERLTGNTVTRSGGWLWRAWDYAGLHEDDGTMRGRARWSGGEERATGRWEVTAEGHYCRRWANHWGEGKRGCFAVKRSGAELIFDHLSGASGGAQRYRYRLLPGNPHGL